jgi:hypothetical protein
MTSLSRPKTPPTGEPPFNGPKTCDATEMLEIHRALRRSFGEATELVDGVAEGDTKHATAVATPPIGIGGSKRYWEAGSPPVAKSGLGEIVPPN